MISLMMGGCPFFVKIYSRTTSKVEMIHFFTEGRGHQHEAEVLKISQDEEPNKNSSEAYQSVRRTNFL